MKSTVSVVFAIHGIVLVFTSILAGMRTIFDGVSASKHVIMLPGTDASQLAAVIGETIIGFTCRGIVSAIPATLIYFALVPFRLRKQWFYMCTRLASYCLLFLFPFGTVCGSILLVMLNHRRSEFLRPRVLS